MSYWTQAEKDAFGFIKLDGVFSPGIITAIETGDGIPLKWDERQGWGLSGNSQLFRGVGLLAFSMTFSLRTNLDRGQWDGPEWQRAIEAPPLGVPARRRKIEHPLLARHKVTECVLLNEPIEQTQPGGLVNFVIKFRQYKKPLPQVSAPSDPNPTKKEPTAKTAAQRRIQANNAQIAALAGG